MDAEQSTVVGSFMGGEICELCGIVSQPEAVETHHIIPTEITSPAGISDSATAALCRNCHQEVHAWYSKKVLDLAYDPANKRFRAKSPAEMVKEYEAAYRIFTQYKKERPKGL